MLNHLGLENVLFIDIETVPLHPTYGDLPDDLRGFWDKKAGYLQKDEESPEETYGQAGIYAEFGKIVCISLGFIHGEEFRIKSFYGDAERELLTEFIALMNSNYSDPNKLLCAHNGKEFDFPYLARRIILNGLELPALLDIAGKKPWEVQHLDTMVLWKFGDYKNYTSLALLANIFGIPTPKSDIDGSDVARVYWEEKDLDRIVEYCQKDVLTIGQLLLKFKGKPMIKEENVIIT
ncbi:MAG: 3'-5' exonuclease [Bacteroidetes bacterium]|nr:MAG: 3'-5' exonuclease [Bacteroidota bacterium]